MTQQRKFKQDMINNKAITLIALVVTIVVLLILAGVSISMLGGENGIITQAIESKENTKIGEEKEMVNLAAQGAKENGYGAITKDRLQGELDNLTDGNAEVTGEGPFTVTYKDSGREYIVETNGNTSEKKTLADLRDSEQPVEGNTTLEDENGDKITIPDGFNIDKDSPIKVVDGIVIEDSYDNEYVWIPVFDKSETRDWGADYSAVATDKTAERASFTTDDYTAIQTALKTYTATYADSNYSDVWYGDENYGQYGYYDGTKFNYYTNGNMSQTEYETLYNNMLVSVYKNGGFYIGRYEMGTGVATSVETAEELMRTEMTEYTASKNTNTSTTVVENGAPSIEGMPIPISKADAVEYNYITQSQAQMLAKKMGETYKYGSTTSSLMFGMQWDAVCVFLEKYGKLKDGTEFNSNYLTNGDYGKLWGNYYTATFTMDRGYYNIVDDGSTGVFYSGWKGEAEKTSDNEIWLYTTGASKQNSALNIFDFGGNLEEFTLERYSGSNYPVTSRGGYFNSTYYASSRYSSITYSCYYDYSARPSLFL